MIVNFRVAAPVKRFGAIFLLLLLTPANILAQRMLTLDGAISAAEEHSPLLQSSAYGVQEAALLVHETQLPPFPALKYKVGASYAPTGRNLGYDPTITNEGQLNGQLSVEGTIYSGGVNAVRKSQANLDFAHAKAMLELTRENLRFDVTQAFLQDLRAARSIMTHRESIFELTDYRDLVDRMFMGGGSAYTDLLKTEVQLGTEQIALEKAISEEVQARYALAALLGASSDTQFVVRGVYDSIFDERAYQKQSFDSLVTLSIGLSANELERARLDVDLVRAQARPTVDANVDAGLLTSVQNLTAPANERAGILGASVGINVEGPILDWGLNKTQIEEKEVTARILETQLLQQRRELIAQLTQLQVLLTSAQDRLALVRSNIKRAEDAYALERAKYAVGGSLASEVLDAERQILDSKLSELDILNDIETYRADLGHLTATSSMKDSTNAK
ncbi:MAG: TolC family protein [Bacteroidota bacterium]|nr:TolC family protein [Bacteroidota bacterium]MDP4233897.1 TolC family protein [Bacteroidota bacterium]MDP4243569.1 TolC family protein [Bacteroidota bacterium]MDP4289243.1 TolC family protein [Bacteroidota bacterium]